MEMNLAQQHTVRMQLIESASLRPDDLTNFYNKYKVDVDGCTVLSPTAPEQVAVLYRTRLRFYDAKIVPFILAGKNPYGQKTCRNDDCINPDHIA
jgi:hypothetical protein